MDIQMKMPDLATTGSDIRVVRWLVQPGEPVQCGQPLLEVETDKAVSQVESIATGVLKEVRVAADAAVSVGQVIAVLAVALSPPSVDRSLAPLISSGPQPSTVHPPPSTFAPRPSRPVRVPLPQPSYDRAFLLSLCERMLLIREFEERVKFLFL